MNTKTFTYAEWALIEDCLGAEKKVNAAELDLLMREHSESVERLNRLRWLQNRNALISRVIKRIQAGIEEEV